MIIKPDCPMCDEDGYKPSGYVCDHVDRTGVRERGMTKVHAALNNLKKMNTTPNPILNDLVERQRKSAPPQPIPDDPEPQL